jgi:phenylpyruvate tautomerase PptA (4-oxalocrotonate tautomerase family)
MPHLQFEVSEPLADDVVDAFVERVTALFAEHMDTGTGHVAVTVRDDSRVALGRAGESDPVAVLNADIRVGRSAEQRRALAADSIGALDDRFGVPPANCYVVYTEHPGADFHLDEGPLDSWDAAEDADGAL